MICNKPFYPITNDISSDKSMGWIERKIQEKFVYSKVQTWAFHVRLKVVQAIIIPMILYFLPLLPRSKKHVDKLLYSILFML